MLIELTPQQRHAADPVQGRSALEAAQEAYRRVTA